MARCEECIHNYVCKYGENRSNGIYCTGEKCKQYQSADVVRKIFDEIDEIIEKSTHPHFIILGIDKLKKKYIGGCDEQG